MERMWLLLMISIIVFESLTHVQRAQSYATTAGYRVEVIRAPRGISQSSCNYALQVSTVDAGAILVMLQRFRIGYVNVFEEISDGRYREVFY